MASWQDESSLYNQPQQPLIVDENLPNEIGMQKESAYVLQHVGSVLPKCMTELIQNRPADPIEYMAQWLYKHRENELHQKMQRLEQHQLIKEKQAHDRVNELTAIGRPHAPVPPEGSVHYLSSINTPVIQSCERVSIPSNEKEQQPLPAALTPHESSIEVSNDLDSVSDLIY